jgi:PAS domain S-box-containing protein
MAQPGMNFVVPHDRARDTSAAPVRQVARFEEMKRYVGWDKDDVLRLEEIRPILAPHWSELIEDFYAEIERHPDVAKVLTGGSAQIKQLKVTLIQWLEQLFHGQYDRDYYDDRLRVGRRHVEIGLSQLYTNLAMARLRDGLASVLGRYWPGTAQTLAMAIRSLNKLIDLDLAIIHDAYQQEYTHRLRETERLRGEHKLRNLVETADCMIVMLRPDHTIAYFSPFTKIFTGYDEAEMLNKDIRSFIVAREDGKGLIHRMDSILEGKPALQVEDQVQCRDGSLRWMIWNARRIHDYEEGSSVLAVGYDISELKRANEKLVQANRLAVIGEMNARLAHESRNALQRLRVCTEMLEFEVEDNPEALGLITRAQKAQDDLQRLFDEVRNYASPVCLEWTPCRISSLWNESWDLLQVQRDGRQAALVEVCDTPDMHVKVDRFRMIQLFRNIFENSLAACSDPVRIIILCREVVMSGNIEALEIHIRDNGPGLDEEAKQLAFQPFFTTKTTGTGLGLAITKRIVEAHGGSIAVGNGQGGDVTTLVNGAEFVLMLPRTPQE